MNTKEMLNTAETVRMRKAKVIAGNGWVRRSGGHFVVRESDKMARYFVVERGRNGDVRCSCPIFKAESKGRPDFRCVHLMAVRYAISLKNTEHALPASTENIVTEPRKSERGEQRHRNAVKEVSELRHLGGIDLTAFRLEKIRGNKEMEQKGSNKSTAAKGVTRTETKPQDNVLDFSTTLRELRNSVDPHLIRKREEWNPRNGAPHMVDYVEWHTVADILDSAAPNWTHTVKDIRTIGEFVAVTVAITIEGVTREGVGTGPAHSETGIKKAEHDALKRAAVKFGIARGFYKRKSENTETEAEPAKELPAFPANPIAMNLSDILSGKQLRMIRAVARERGIDAEKECSRKMNCAVNELSKRAASALIDHLQTMDPAPAEVPLRKAG